MTVVAVWELDMLNVHDPLVSVQAPVAPPFVTALTLPDGTGPLEELTPTPQLIIELASEHPPAVFVVTFVWPVVLFPGVAA